MFNCSNSKNKLDLLNAILTVAKTEKELDTVSSILIQIDSWLDKCEVNTEEKSKVYLFIAEAGFDSNITLEFTQKYLEIDPNQALARNAIKIALNLPSVLLFENIAVLDAVKDLKGELLFELLEIFSSKTLSEYNSFVKTNPKFLEKNGLEIEILLNKIRLLTLDSLAIVNVGKRIKYEVISKALGIPLEKVEYWVIDGILIS
jgi:hypothetical protein